MARGEDSPVIAARAPISGLQTMTGHRAPIFGVEALSDAARSFQRLHGANLRRA